MKRSAPILLATTLLSSLGCPSKDNQSTGATSPSGATATASTGAGTGTGPLANLEAAPFVNEVWIGQEGGQQMQFLFYTRENVRISAQCRSGAGQLSCDAIRQLRGGMPVEMDEVPGLVKRIGALGWHVELLFAGHELPGLLPLLRTLDAPISIGHFGYMPAAEGVANPAFQDLLELVAEGAESDLNLLQEQVEQAMRPYIDDMEVCSSPATGEFTRFEIAF